MCPRPGTVRVCIMPQVKCPELVLVSGEDLSPYRQASRAVLSVLARFGVVSTSY